MPDAVPKHVESTKVWLENTGCIARDETAYLDYEDFDLLNIGNSRSNKPGGIESLIPCIESVIGGMSEKLRRVPSILCPNRKVSADCKTS